MDWVTSKELIALDGMPNSSAGINYRAKMGNWKKRRKPNTEGNVYEYLVSSLPAYLQAQLNQPLASEIDENSLIQEDIFVLRKEIKQLKQLKQLKQHIQTQTLPSALLELSEQEETLIQLFRNASEMGKIAILAAAHGAEKKVS